MGKAVDTQIPPPLRLETLESYAQEVFAPIRRGESVTTIWVPMMGRRVRNKFIISFPQLFKKEIGNPGKYLLVYVEPLELTEESNSGYLNLLIRSIIESYNKQQGNGNSLESKEFLLDSTSYPQLLESLERLLYVITRQDIEVVLFLGEFDELKFADSILYNNLKSLWVKFTGKLHFVFLLLADAAKPESIQRFDELNEVLLKNVVYVPLVDKEDTSYLIGYFAKQFDKKFSNREQRLLIEICGGHPLLLKACSRIIALMNGQKMKIDQLKEMLVSHFEPRSAAQKIFDLRTAREQDILRDIVGQKIVQLPEDADTLAKLGLIVETKDGWKPFGTLFESVIQKGQGRLTTPSLTEGHFSFDESSGAILADGRNIEEKFTRQEYEILRFLLNEHDKLKSRDEISQAMWGKESYDKYSDWAIDQVMSKLRKKLKDFGADRFLVTVRGRGYKLALS